MSASELTCWNCGQSLAEIPKPISRHEQCPQCFEALHCCRLCRHFRADRTGQCDEERADPPVVKENANFCDWFAPAAGAFVSSREGKRAAAEDELNALFGQAADSDTDGDAQADPDPESGPATPPSKEAEARARLDELFGKD